jgi:hypothetical protein
MFCIKPLMLLVLLCFSVLIHAQVRYTISYTDSVTGRLRVTGGQSTAP